MAIQVIKKLKRTFRFCIYGLYYFVLKKLFRIYLKEQNNRRFNQARPPVVKLVEFNNTRFVIYIGSHGAIEDSILRHGDWSGDLLLLSDYFISPNSVVIEIGANIGFESLYFAKKFPDAIVCSYEPGTYPYASLLLSKNYNRLENLKIFKLGVGDTIKNVELSSPSAESKNKGLGSIKLNKDLEDTYQKESIQVVTLDSHFSEERRVSLMKIDTQGYEWNVLQGAVKTINKNRPAIIFEHEDQYHENPKEIRQSMAAFFEQANYDLYIPGEHFLTRFDFCSAMHVHGDIVALPRN